jgi:hypothetical protein
MRDSQRHFFHALAPPWSQRDIERGHSPWVYALTSCNSLSALGANDQSAAFGFLNSLVRFPPDDTASTLDPKNPAKPKFSQYGHGSITLTVLFNDPTDLEQRFRKQEARVASVRLGLFPSRSVVVILLTRRCEPAPRQRSSLPACWIASGLHGDLQHARYKS